MDININYLQWLEKPEVEKLLEEELTESIITKLYLTTPGEQKEAIIIFPTLMYLIEANGGSVKLDKKGDDSYFSIKIEFSLKSKDGYNSGKPPVYFGKLNPEQVQGVDIPPLKIMYLKAEELGPNALSFITPFITREGVWKAN